MYVRRFLVFDSGMPRRSSFINRNDSVDSTTACSLGNQSLSNALTLGGASNFLGVPKSDSPGLLAVPTGHCGKLTNFNVQSEMTVEVCGGKYI